MQTTRFLNRQLEIIDGSLLGDGHLTNPKYGDSAFVKAQCLRHKPYLEWTFQELSPFSSRLKDSDNKCNGKTYKRTTFSTGSNPYLSELRSKWYPNGVKIVPRDLRLTPLSTAIWFFDDGSNSVQERCAKFATYCFTRSDCEFLQSQLVDLGVKTTITKRNVMLVKTESYFNLVEMIRPYMLWSCFEHKVAYRDAEITAVTDEEANLMNCFYEQGLTLEEISFKTERSISAISNAIRQIRKPSVALNNKSGATGVSWDAGRLKWKAYVKKDGKTVNLGRFDKREDAILARSVWAKRM